jgi:3-oxoacyl-[acyl-carrier-protein] synthase-1
VSGTGQLVVTGVSAVTAVGANAEQTCASVRAGLSGLSEHAFFAPTTRDPEWDDEEPLLVGTVRGVDPSLPGPARLVELAILALRELGSKGLARRDLARTALLVALPLPDAAVAGWQLGQHFVPAFCRRSGLVAFASTFVTQSGHTGIVELLPRAEELLAKREVDRCVLLGVDSYLAQDRLEALDAGFRLKSVRAVDGFIPGEGAAALLVEDRKAAEARGAPVSCVVSSYGFGREPIPQSGDRQSSGAGLTAALEAVLGGRPSGPRWVICDLNGESYRSFEWGVATVKLSAAFAGSTTLVHPAQAFGDVGAASGALHVALAAAAFGRGYAPCDDATLWAASDGDLRAAARVERAS